MNILHIISSPASGGAEVYVKDLAINLSNQGHNLHIAFLSNASDIGRDIIYEERFLNDLKSSGINIFVIGNETRKKPWLGMLRIKQYISEHNIDICHTHLAFGILFTALSSVPIVYTHHSMEPRWGKFLYQVFNRLVDEYVGISTKCAEALKSYTGRNINIIPNAVSEEKFIGYKKIRKSKNVINIVMVGRITEQKDYMNMLIALTLIDKKLKNKFRVRIAGEGDAIYKSQLLTFIHDKNLEEIVDFVGTRLHGGIRALQKNIRTIIIGVDNRALEKKKDFHLPVIDRNEIEDLEYLIQKDYKLDIKLPNDNINKFKKSFLDYNKEFNDPFDLIEVYKGY